MALVCKRHHEVWYAALVLFFGIDTILTRNRVLKPGGWCQMVEYYHMCQSDNGSITDTNALRRWSLNYMRALDSTKDPRIPMQLRTVFSEAGMVNVESRMIPVHFSGWSNGECLRNTMLSSGPTKVCYEHHTLFRTRSFFADCALEAYRLRRCSRTTHWRAEQGCG